MCEWIADVKDAYTLHIPDVTCGVCPAVGAVPMERG